MIVEIGEDTVSLLGNLDVSANEEKKTMENFYITVAIYFQNKLLLQNQILRDFTCLDPKVLKKTWIIKAAGRITRAIPQGISGNKTFSR